MKVWERLRPAVGYYINISDSLFPSCKISFALIPTYFFSQFLFYWRFGTKSQNRSDVAASSTLSQCQLKLGKNIISQYWKKKDWKKMELNFSNNEIIVAENESNRCYLWLALYGLASWDTRCLYSHVISQVNNQVPFFIGDNFGTIFYNCQSAPGPRLGTIKKFSI